MKPSNVAVVLGLAAAVASLPSQARDHREGARGIHRNASGMQVVRVRAPDGQPGHGWRYFVDRREARAVVISPEGAYYYSEGQGLDLVYKPNRAA